MSIDSEERVRGVVTRDEGRLLIWRAGFRAGLMELTVSRANRKMEQQA